jgi:hypothetical protein
LRRFARVGFGIAAVATVVVVLVAIPNLTAPVRGPSETCGLKVVTTIHTAQVQYYSDYGRFATNLRELGPPDSGPEGPSAANLIENDLANGEKCGCRFALTGTPGGYSITAEPSQFGADCRLPDSLKDPPLIADHP